VTGILPLALTLGEPAGIGPDVTLAAWHDRRRLRLPPFYCLADPELLAKRARQIGLDCPIVLVDPAAAVGAFDRALPVARLTAPVAAEPGRLDGLNAPAVIEAIAALADLRVPVRVIGVIGASENLPSATAVKPSDVVRALDGTTIEINNTDAEGRLVLADCLTHIRREGCDRIVDIATLTGAVTTALGTVYAGLMSNEDAWAAAVTAAGQRSGEPVWRLPLHDRYAEMVRGRYAELTNRTERREAAAITAAEFLHHFAGEVPWAHLDIAAVADNLPRPYLDKGASGFGVRLLVELAPLSR